MSREPRLAVPNQRPTGRVMVDTNHHLADGLKGYYLFGNYRGQNLASDKGYLNVNNGSLVLESERAIHDSKGLFFPKRTADAGSSDGQRNLEIFATDYDMPNFNTCSFFVIAESSRAADEDGGNADFNFVSASINATGADAVLFFNNSGTNGELQMFRTGSAARFDPNFSAGNYIELGYEHYAACTLDSGPAGNTASNGLFYKQGNGGVLSARDTSIVFNNSSSNSTHWNNNTQAYCFHDIQGASIKHFEGYAKALVIWNKELPATDMIKFMQNPYQVLIPARA